MDIAIDKLEDILLLSADKSLANKFSTFPIAQGHNFDGTRFHAHQAK